MSLPSLTILKHQPQRHCPSPARSVSAFHSLVKQQYDHHRENDYDTNYQNNNNSLTTTINNPTGDYFVQRLLLDANRFFKSIDEDGKKLTYTVNAIVHYYSEKLHSAASIELCVYKSKCCSKVQAMLSNALDYDELHAEFKAAAANVFEFEPGNCEFALHKRRSYDDESNAHSGQYADISMVYSFKDFKFKDNPSADSSTMCSMWVKNSAAILDNVILNKVFTDTNTDFETERKAFMAAVPHNRDDSFYQTGNGIRFESSYEKTIAEELDKPAEDKAEGKA